MWQADKILILHHSIQKRRLGLSGIAESFLRENEEMLSPSPTKIAAPCRIKRSCCTGWAPEPPWNQRLISEYIFQIPKAILKDATYKKTEI